MGIEHIAMQVLALATWQEWQGLFSVLLHVLGVAVNSAIYFCLGCMQRTGRTGDGHGLSWCTQNFLHRSSTPEKRLDDGRDDAGPSAGAQGSAQAAVGCGDYHGRHGALRLLEGPDEVRAAGWQAIRVGLVGCREVVHLVVQNDACTCVAACEGIANESCLQS